MSGFEIFGIVAGVIGFVPLVREVRSALIVLAGKDDRVEKLACDVVDTLNKHADFYQRIKASLKDEEITQSLKRMEILLQLMKDRCDKEKRRRASAFKRMKVLIGREDLEKDIRVLQDRLSEERRSWMANVSLRIYESMEALQKRVAETKSDIIQHQAQNQSRTGYLIQQNEVVIMDRINTLSAEFKSVSAYVPRRRGANILLTAEEVHGLQNKPPELIIRKWAGFNTFQVCSAAYCIDMRRIREFYERNLTPTSTRNENLIGPLRDAVDRIFEHLGNEECSLAHLVRALSVLLSLVDILEDNRISLDRQTRDEVEACAARLTSEYLQRGRYNVVDLKWALEWASARTIEEIAPQVPHRSVENLVDVMGPGRLAALARLVGLAGPVGAVNVARLVGAAGPMWLMAFAVDINYVSRFGHLARLALDHTPQSDH